MSVTDITIRRAEPGDVEALYSIERRCFAQPHWDEQSFLRYDSLVVLSGGVIAGFLVSRLVFSATGGAAVEREILNVAVDPPFRRKGLGDLLLSAELEQGGVHFLEVRESNAPARRLYEKHGFRAEAMRKGYYDAPVENAILMRHEASREGLEKGSE
jgi:[ribosomal protein S18]-alanine N-acetyltransferase